MWEASESEVNSWLVDSLLQPSKKLKNCWNKKTQKTREGWQKKAKELFHEYLKEKSVQKPEDKKDTIVEIVCRYFVYLLNNV